jgi:cytoskeletal protein RodZ
MLNNSNENNDNKLFGSDTPASGNRLYGANEPNDEVKLFGADAPQEQKKLFGVEDDLNEDEFVKSSFAVSFKANEAANTVSEKLNEEAEKALDAELNSIAPPVVPVPENNTPSYNDGWEDEFDNFEFDSSVSAFKPLAPEAAPVFPSDDKSDFNAPAAVPVEDKIEEPAPAPAPEPEAEAEPEPQIEEPVIEAAEAQIEEAAAPVFDDSDSDLYVFAGDAVDQQDLFNSGDDLDFATSETDKDVSPFANAEKPAEPEAADIDIPSNNIDSEIESYGKVSSGVNAFKPVEQPQEAEAPAAVEEAAHAEEDNDSEIGSYGKVSSGVNAFKSQAAEPAEAPIEKAPEAAAEEYIDPENVVKTRPGDDIENTPAEISDEELRSRYTPTSNTGKMYMNNRQAGNTSGGKGDVSRLHKKPTPPVKKTPAPSHATSAPAAAAAPAVNPAFKPAADIKAKDDSSAFKNDVPADNSIDSAAENNAAVSAFVPRGRTNAVSDTDNRSVRPGSSNKSQPASRPIPVTNASKNVAPKSARSGRNEISPVTPSAVSKKKSRRSRSSKESGKSGIITLIVIIVLFIGAIFVMDHLNDIKNFFSGGTDSVATLETTTTATSASEDSTTTTTTSEATTTTTTTEATTTTTTTEATTTTTTSEATTTTTTEATTTTTTTEATTTTTTKKDSSSGGVKVTNFETKLKNFKRTAGGFSFEITMENKSNNDASLTKSLNAIELRVYADQDIKKVTADGFKFKENDGKWIGTPSDMTIKAGAKVKFTVTVSTSGNVGHFGYRSCFFDWK